jgi:membrane protein DedA with SNARE-associated domain
MPISTYFFYAAIFFAIFGSVLGLIGIWHRGFWDNEISIKLIMTDMVLLVAAIIVSAIIRFLR